MDTTLWVNELGDRYFEIPNSIMVQPGAFAILSLLDERHLSVNEAALERFAIGEDAARERFYEAIGPLFDETVRSLVENWQEVVKPGLETMPAMVRQVISMLLGVAEGDVDSYPALRGVRAADLLREISAAMAAAPSPASEQQVYLRAQVRDIRRRLRAEGIDVDQRFEQIASDVFPQEQLAALLDQCGQLLVQASVESEEQLRDLFALVERDFGHLLVEDKKTSSRREKERLREYRKSADDAIAASLRAHGLTPAADLPPAPTKRGRRG